MKILTISFLILAAPYVYAGTGDSAGGSKDGIVVNDPMAEIQIINCNIQNPEVLSTCFQDENDTTTCIQISAPQSETSLNCNFNN